ncbi:MAG: hypothetical protein ACOC38_11220, partial [Promethearchaeia archaeon]
RVFSTAVAHYLDSSVWKSRGVWLGPGVTPGELELFGITIPYQMEGYTDYSFFYVHWGHNILRGVLPYCEDFGHIVIDGVENNNGLYIFPPYSALFYGLGILFPVNNWGIGLLIAICGYLAVLPVYGIATELSSNRHVGEIAALTYLLNPLTLYHTTYLWTNTAPFIFSFFLGYYLLLRNHKYLGTFCFVTAALFKQTAWFLGLPLIIHLLLRPRPISGDKDPELEPIAAKSKISFMDDLIDRIDFLGFAKNALLACIYAAIVLLPFYLAQPQMIAFLLLAAGGFPLESFTEPPSYGQPMRLQVLPVVADMPELAMLLDLIVSSGALLWFGVVVFVGLMLIEPKDEGRVQHYLGRVLFLTMLMMFWVHLMGPRGVFKYYFTLFVPFFSIFSSASMIQQCGEHVNVSLSMLWFPFVASLLILIPPRNIYFVFVLLILFCYLLAGPIGKLWRGFTSPIRRLVPQSILIMCRRISMNRGK